MAMSLTHAQAELLAVIERYQSENNGVSPSFEEMREAIGLHSKSGVHRLIQGLIERGRLTTISTPRDRRARALEIIPETDELQRFPTSALVAELARRGEQNRRAA